MGVSFGELNKEKKMLYWERQTKSINANKKALCRVALNKIGYSLIDSPVVSLRSKWPESP